MAEESTIFEGGVVSNAEQSGFYDFKLLKTTAYSVLYRASKAGKHFLIKTTKDNSEHQLALLKREYELSIGCDHPHIVHVFTYEDNLPVGAGIVMEYIEGRTLAEYMLERPTKRICNRLFEELLSAVDYLHKRGVIHNDLKPENILVTRADNTLKLIDFGLADNDAHFALRTLGCTPHYASPELQRQEGVDARSDIYSIGVLMSELFGSKHRRIGAKCCSVKLGRRYSNVASLQQAWAHRNRLPKMFLWLVVSLLFVLPTVLLVYTKVEARNETRSREQLFARIERDVEHIYEVASDSISRAVYYEFAINNIVSFWEALVKYQQESIVTIVDPELNTLATNVYTHAVNRCNNNLQELAKALPVMERDGMSYDEIMFYNWLIARRRPYQPYSAE